MKILLVEDEALLLDETAEMLVSFGHQVITASSAEQALHEMSESLGYDFLISDMKMPGMSGLELIRLVRRTYSKDVDSMRCVLISGHLSASYVESELEEENISFIQKPVSAKRLLAEIEQE